MNRSGVYIVSGIRHPIKHSVSLFCVGSVCCSSKEVPGFILVIITKAVTGHTCNEENPLGYISKFLFALLLFVRYLESHWMPSVVAFLRLQADVATQLCAGWFWLLSVTSLRAWTSHVFLWCNTNTSCAPSEIG